MKKNLLLISISILISLFFFEIFLRVFLPQDTSTPWRVYLKNGLLLNKNNGSAYHYFVKNDIKVKYNFGKFHNRKYDLSKSKNKILILGDSNPFGWLLEDKDTYIYKIAEKFPNYEFINSSAGGHGTSDQLRYFDLFCKKIKPKITFVLINFDDIGRSKVSNLYYLDNAQILKKGTNKVPKIYKITDDNIVYEFLVSNFHFMGFLRKSYVIISNYKFLKKNNPEIKSDLGSNENQSKTVKVETKPINKNYDFERKLYLNFKSISEECETKLILINLAWFDASKYMTNTYDFLKNNTEFFQEYNINYIDLNDGMKVKHNNPDEYVIKNEGHPNLNASNLYFSLLYKEFEKIIK